MNRFICTGRIITQPKLSRHKKNPLVEILVCLPNNKRGLQWYCVQANAKKKLGIKIFDFYKKGDFIIIEGFIKIKSEKIIMHNQSFKIKKYIYIKVKRIHPALIFIK